MNSYYNVVLENSLLGQSESLKIEFIAKCNKKPSNEVIVYPLYLETGRAHQQRMHLKWEKKSYGFRGILEYKPEIPGNYYLEWQPDEKTGYLYRYFAVIGEGHTLCNLYWQCTGDDTPPRNDRAGCLVYAHEHHLPGDFSVEWDMANPSSPYIECEWRYGDSIHPQINDLQQVANLHLSFKIRDSGNLWSYSKEEVTELLKKVKEHWEKVGYESLDTFSVYTVGNSVIEGCRKAGIRFLHGLCSPSRDCDGGWKINMYGAPMSPWFIADDDYRKPAAIESGRDDFVFAANMEMRNPVMCRRYGSSSFDPFAPINILMFERTCESGEHPYRFYEAADGMLDRFKTTGQDPILFYLNAQFFGTHQTSDYNRKALEYLATKAKQGKLVFCDIHGYAGYLMRHMKSLPEHVSYWRDTQVGQAEAGKRTIFSDVMFIENANLQAAFEEGKVLPDFIYDYTPQWNYPVWSKDENVPAVVDMKGFEVMVIPLKGISNSLRKFKIVVNAPRRQKNLALGLWSLAGRPIDEIQWKIKPRGKFIPVRKPQEGSLHGILVVDVKKGQQSFELEVKSEFEEVHPLKRELAGLIGLQTFEYNGKPYTYIALQEPMDVLLEIGIKPGTTTVEDKVQVEYLSGKIEDISDRNLFAVKLGCSAFERWARVWGVRAFEIEIHNLEQVLLKYLTSAKGEIMNFAPKDSIAPSIPRTIKQVQKHNIGGKEIPMLIDRYKKWQWKVAPLVWEKDHHQLQEWFRERYLKGKNQELLVSCECARKLPPAEEVRRHRIDPYNFIECAKGIRVSDGQDSHGTSFDVGTCWYWGHSAWRMWNWLIFTIYGLDKYKDRKKLVLYLHAYDYECKQAVFDVFLNKIGLGGREATLVKYNWELPQGPEGRYAEGSIVPIEVPSNYKTLDAVSIWISPARRHKVYNWVREGAYVGHINDFWLVAES